MKIIIAGALLIMIFEASLPIDNIAADPIHDNIDYDCQCDLIADNNEEINTDAIDGSFYFMLTSDPKGCCIDGEWGGRCGSQCSDAGGSCTTEKDCGSE